MHEKYVADSRDSFSVAMMDQYLDLGSLNRQMTPLTHK